MAWEPDAKGNAPRILARRVEVAAGAQVVLYPSREGNHAALGRLLTSLVDDQFPAARTALPGIAPGTREEHADPEAAIRWVPAAEPVPHFTGRSEELARLDQWAADPEVSLIGVTAWGGAGKTTLVTHWANQRSIGRGAKLRALFGWSFYTDPSADRWAESLLQWARQDLRIKVMAAGRPAAGVLALLRAVPLLLVLDGLELVQEGPTGGGFGRLLDGTLREVLAGACQQDHGGLIVLTSRFPFADLEGFDGGRARMLEVPPFTPAEGSALLATAGAGWLPETERRSLVRAVDGHALATAVLAGLLAAQPTASDLVTLRTELAEATRTDTRVGKVLRFYSAQLAEPDRYLLAALSLFTRPVPAETVLRVARHKAFGNQLVGWSPDMLQAAVVDRLGGLAAWHPDGAISAHPLVRDAFRPLVLAAAGSAAETSLTGLPAGTVTSRAHALRVVEAIELLLDADLWDDADDLYRSRAGFPPVWLTLPAAQPGQRASTAFVATPARRDACAAVLGPERLGFYLNEAGLFAMYAGDLAAAREYLRMTVRHGRDSGTVRALSIKLRNQAECLSYLGHVDLAREAAAEALAWGETLSDAEQTRNARAFLGWLAYLSGRSEEAEQQFAAADQVEVTGHPSPAVVHLYSLRGVQWAEWLARTGRPGPARALTEQNIDISRRYEWNENLARCDRMLGRLALTAGDTTLAGQHLTAAVEHMRDGDYLTELATTLADLARYAGASGDLIAAERHVSEAIAIAGPRGLVPAQSVALVERARFRASQVSGDADRLAQGRDAADAALRLATRHQLAWHELDAVQAHSLLDQAEGTDRGWAARADALRVRLILPQMDPDPMVTAARRTGRWRQADG